MRLLPILAAALALAAPSMAMAGYQKASGYYDGKAVCADGETQLTVVIEVDSDNGVTGTITINATAPTVEYEVSGTLTHGTDLDLTPGKWVKTAAGGKMYGFKGTWFDTDANGDITIIGKLAGGGCKTFTLVQDAMYN